MSTKTLKDVFSSSITDFYVNHVSTHLCDWLKTNKGIECTQEELCDAFGIEYTPRSNMAGLPQAASMGTQMPNLPGYYHGTGASPSRRGGGRKKNPPDPNAPKCVYQFQRGNRQGQVCGEPVSQSGEPGSNEYCKGCLKKKTVQSRIKSGSADKSVVRPPVLPGGMVAVQDQEKASEEKTIDAVPLDGHSDLFKDLEHHFILKKLEDDSLIAIGVEENGNHRPLTADEKTTAQSLGLSIMSNGDELPEAVPDQTIPTIPTVPQVSQTTPTVPAVPQIDGVVPTIPPVGIPKIPNVAQVATQ